MGAPDFSEIVCTVCGTSLTRISVTGDGEASVTWEHPRDGRARGHAPAPGLFSPDGPRPEWTCDFCGSAPPSCWWQPGPAARPLPEAFIAPGLSDASAAGPWMACPGCSALVAVGDLAGLMRRWRDLSPAPPGTDPQANLRRSAPAVATVFGQLLNSDPSGPYPLP